MLIGRNNFLVLVDRKSAPSSTRDRFGWKMGLEQLLISHFIKASRSSWHRERKKDGSRRIVDSSRWNCKMFEKRLSESRRRFRSIFFVRAKSGARNELSFFFISFFFFVNYTLSETNVLPEWFFHLSILFSFIKNRDYTESSNYQSNLEIIFENTSAMNWEIKREKERVYTSVKVSNVFRIYS